MSSNFNQTNEVKVGWSKLLLNCVLINKQIESEFNIKDILFIYKLIFAANIDTQKYFDWSKNVNLECLEWLWYSKKIYSLIIDLINNLEDRINALSPEKQLEGLHFFFEEIKEKTEEQEKIHNKIFLRKLWFFVSLVVLVIILSIIYNSDLLWFLIIVIVFVGWGWLKKSINFTPQLDDAEKVRYNFITNSNYLKVLCIMKYKDKIETKIKNELKNINKLENKSYLETINPFEFEKLIWKTFWYFGFKARVTKKTGDKWVDIWLENDSKEKSIVQCKRLKWKIGTPTIRDFIWTMQMHKINSWYIITTSNFSVDSLLAIEESDYKIQLIDMDGVISMIQAMNNWEKNSFDEILNESARRIWREWNKNYQIKKDNQRKYRFKKR